MQQRGGVNELNCRRQMHRIRPAIAAQISRSQRQHRAQPFAPSLNQMRSDFGNPRRVFAGHPLADQRINIRHTIAQVCGHPLMRFDGKLVHALHTPVGIPRQTDADALISIPMKQLLATSDPTVIAFAKALLQGEGITAFEMDVNMSVLEGSIGILPRRVMVADRDYPQAVRTMRDNGIEPVE